MPHAATHARAEDLQWMADTGENLTRAAERLGMTPKSLHKWCNRHGHLHLYQQLAARETDPKYHPTSKEHTAA